MKLNNLFEIAAFAYGIGEGREEQLAVAKWVASREFTAKDLINLSDILLELEENPETASTESFKSS